MKRVRAVIFVLIGAAVICSIAYWFSPIGTGRTQLNDEQIESLCNEWNEEDTWLEEEYGNLSFTQQTAVKIFGIESKGDVKTVYGYVSNAYYIKVKDNAYADCGGNYEFMCDIKVNGNAVKIIKSYGDGVSSESTYEEMPLRYRFKISHYNPFDGSGYCKIMKEADRKAEAVLGVPVDTEFTLSINGSRYEIFNIDASGTVIVKEKGKVSELYENKDQSHNAYDAQ